MGHSSVRTNIYYIYGCFDYHFSDFADICWFVHLMLFVFFQGNMPTEAGHSSEIVASEYRGNSLPADENTPLVREASSAIRQLRSCENFNCRHFLLIGLSLLSFAEVVLLIICGILSTPKLSNKQMKAIVSLNVVEIGNCFFFLGIIVKSPSFVGFSTALKDLCRLPNFWTLLLFFLIYFLTGVSTIIQIAHRVDRLVIVRMVLQILDFFSLMILVVFLNHTKLRHTISGRAYILLKGALILFCFRFFLMLVGNTIHVIYANDKAKNITMLLLLPFVKKITELLWGKIFFDEKCIIGELRRNRDTNQITFVA